VGELLVFLVVTAVVNRPRPDVPLLDAAPPTSSFPSGHTAAAVAFYGCLAVIVLRQLRPRWLAVTIATLLCLVPLVVGISRLYRGMHHPTDVVFGALGGGLWLALVLSTLLPRPGKDVAQVVSPDAHEEPESRLVT
jgi:undecaprenyl-diphosphatase